MAGLDPAIHVFFLLYVEAEDVDARHKAGHDDRIFALALRRPPEGSDP
jgi:hypothetical protein